jgi:hypothetical protein
MCMRLCLPWTDLCSAYAVLRSPSLQTLWWQFAAQNSHVGLRDVLDSCCSQGYTTTLGFGLSHSCR